MKVYGMTMFIGGMQTDRQRRAYVAAPSKKAAAAAFGVSLHEFNKYGAETGNAVVLDVALRNPGAVFVAPLNQAPSYMNMDAARLITGTLYIIED